LSGAHRLQNLSVNRWLTSDDPTMINDDWHVVGGPPTLMLSGQCVTKFNHEINLAF
jgi:hypothetical protein